MEIKTTSFGPKLKNTQEDKDFSNFISAFDGEDGKNWILNLKTGHNARRIFLSSVIIHKSSHEPLLWTEEYSGLTANFGLFWVTLLPPQ